MSERIAPTRTPEFEARLKKRYASERRFRALGLGAIVFSVAVLVFLLGTMTFNGIGGFQRVEMEVPIDFTEAGIAADPAAMEQPGALASLEAQGLRDVVQYFAEEELGEAAAEELGAQAWRDVATAIIADPAVLQRSESFWLPASANLASGYEGEGSPEMQALAAGLYEEGRLAKNFDPGFLGRSDATNPQQVGIWGALKGSLLTMVMTLLLAFPIGVLAALYLEEYAPKNRWTDLIELSINNLAAVPSIIFGLLGLAVFLTLFPNLRSAPLIGGMTLALMTMPVIVIAGRNAIKAVPPSIRDG
ncbi:phosphate ABC transporter permease, partial [Erythrobacter sp. HI0019]